MKEPEDNPYVREPDLDFDDPEEMDESRAEEQVELLREAVEYHDYRYYVENDPVISDRAYDRLFDRLKTLEEEFGLQTENSPTQRVGGKPVDELETREHVAEMKSLASSEEEEDVRSFNDRVERETGKTEYHVEPKFDGLSVEFVYRDGELEAAVTRGNGVEGDDITSNARTINSVPLRLHEAPELLVVRGEVYMPRDGFQELNEERVERGEKPFANPRNAAAGTVRQLDPKVVADRPLSTYFYDIMETSTEIDSQEEAMDLLENVGLRVNEYNRVVSDIQGFIDYRNEMLEKRDDLNYDIDGVVAKVNPFDPRETLGETAAHPRWAYAYKFPAKTGETTVEKIVVQVGRTGKLTPVALLQPVDVKGVTISRATLHNESQARELGIAEDAKVRIQRAGDVIPEVEEVVEGGGEKFEMPSECPVCGSEVVKEGEYHFCTGGVSCPAQLQRKLQYFASEECMDIRGIGEKVAAQLVENNLVESIADLYRLEKDELVSLEKFADKSAEKLLEEIDESQEVELSRFINALGIRHVGAETARKLSQRFSLEELLEADRAELQKVEDIGPEVAESIRGFFEGRGRELVDELLEEGVEPYRAGFEKELEGLTLVFTGSLEGFTRQEVTELMERHGADVSSSVSGETDYVVVGDNPGSKLEDARELGVETLDEPEFEERILSRIEEVE